MGTSVVRYQAEGSPSPKWGVLRDGRIHELQLEAFSHRNVMQSYFAQRESFDAAIAPASVQLSGAQLLAPVSPDIQLFCQGLNYADHRQEGGLDKGSEEEENLIFAKASGSICGPEDAIVRPRGCELLDYEIELGLVLKRDLAEPMQIPASELGGYIGALVLANDVSARDFMFGAPAMQWFKGKSQRTFCPLGPVLFLLDEVDFGRLDQLELVLRLNGEVKQRATTDLLIHKPASTLSDLSSFTLVRAGDVVLTGTPGGVLVGVNARTALAIVLNMRNDAKRREKFVAAQLARTRFLQPGDVLELEIRSTDGTIDLGRQRNVIVDEDVR